MTAPASPAIGVRFENIDKRYGSVYALRRVSVEIQPGDCVAFAGRNGSGKTTLLRVAARLVRPSAGKLSFVGASGNAVDGASPEKHAGFVAHATMAYDELTAEENLLLFARLQGVGQPAFRVQTLLREVELYDRRDAVVRTFSRGMRQRVAIARALLAEPSLLLLDEPATGLDPEGMRWLANTLHGLHRGGCTILMSVHGESEISALATRAIRLDAGAIIADTHRGANLHAVLTFAEA